MFVRGDRLTQPNKEIILGLEDGFTKDGTSKKSDRDKCRGLETRTGHTESGIIVYKLRV